MSLKLQSLLKTELWLWRSSSLWLLFLVSSLSSLLLLLLRLRPQSRFYVTHRLASDIIKVEEKTKIKFPFCSLSSTIMGSMGQMLLILGLGPRK